MFQGHLFQHRSCTRKRSLLIARIITKLKIHCGKIVGFLYVTAGYVYNYHRALQNKERDLHNRRFLVHWDVMRLCVICMYTDYTKRTAPFETWKSWRSCRNVTKSRAAVLSLAFIKSLSTERFAYPWKSSLILQDTYPKLLQFRDTKFQLSVIVELWIFTNKKLKNSETFMRLM